MTSLVNCYERMIGENVSPVFDSGLNNLCYRLIFIPITSFILLLKNVIPDMIDPFIGRTFAV